MLHNCNNFDLNTKSWQGAGSYLDLSVGKHIQTMAITSIATTSVSPDQRSIEDTMEYITIVLLLVATAGAVLAAVWVARTQDAINKSLSTMLSERSDEGKFVRVSLERNKKAAIATVAVLVVTVLATATDKYYMHANDATKDGEIADLHGTISTLQTKLSNVEAVESEDSKKLAGRSLSGQQKDEFVSKIKSSGAIVTKVSIMFASACSDCKRFAEDLAEPLRKVGAEVNVLAWMPFAAAPPGGISLILKSQDPGPTVNALASVLGEAGYSQIDAAVGTPKEGADFEIQIWNNPN